MIFRPALVLAIAATLFVVPAAAADEVRFADTAGASYEDAVVALADAGIVQGCGDDQFCADEEVTRGQVATILARALALPPADADALDRFEDTRTSTHRATIAALAAADLTAGCDTVRFCPDEPVTRAQLATMLQQAFGMPAAPSDAAFYVDVDGVHAPGVRSITAAGVGAGCGLVEFCGGEHLRRAHAAMFVARSLDLVARVELAPFEERLAEHEEVVAAERAAEEEAAAAAAAAPGAKAVEVAIAQLGKPYRWGGSGPDSFDCSGLTSFAWRAAGITLPRSSGAQYTATTRISRSELRPGDLVFYHSPISHVAMYIGDGRVVESPNSGNNVRIREDGLTRSGVVGFGRP